VEKHPHKNHNTKTTKLIKLILFANKTNSQYKNNNPIKGATQQPRRNIRTKITTQKQKN